MDLDEPEDIGALVTRFEESAERVRVQRSAPGPKRLRAPRFRKLLPAVGVGVATIGCAIGLSSGGTVPDHAKAMFPGLNLSVHMPTRSEPAWPVKSAVAKAEDIARSREGLISFAAIGPGGRTVGFEPDRQYFSASVTKCMLLVAELRRLRREGLPLDEATQSTLNSMITLSDNLAADQIYARVGDAGLQEVAKLAGMTRFEATVGHWSNAQITAADMTAFMSKLDNLLDIPGGDAASEMLASVIPAQSWGVPQSTPRGARVRFKGGWRPSDLGELVHQAARVDAGGKSYSLAVLTDGNPSMPYGEETIRLIAAELLRTHESQVSRSRGSGAPGS